MWVLSIQNDGLYSHLLLFFSLTFTHISIPPTTSLFLPNRKAFHKNNKSVKQMKIMAATFLEGKLGMFFIISRRNRIRLIAVLSHTNSNYTFLLTPTFIINTVLWTAKSKKHTHTLAFTPFFLRKQLISMVKIFPITSINLICWTLCWNSSRQCLPSHWEKSNNNKS